MARFKALGARGFGGEQTRSEKHPGTSTTLKIETESAYFVTPGDVFTDQTAKLERSPRNYIKELLFGAGEPVRNPRELLPIITI